MLNLHGYFPINEHVRVLNALMTHFYLSVRPLAIRLEWSTLHKFSVTERSARKLHEYAYQYVKQKSFTNALTSWESVDWWKGSCKADVKLDVFNAFAEQAQEYIHVLSPSKCALTKSCVNNKRKTSTAHNTAKQNIVVEFANVTPPTAVNLQNLNNIRRSIRHQTHNWKETFQFYPISTKWHQWLKGFYYFMVAQGTLIEFYF